MVFVTEDDSQAGWDHVSAYRTTGFVVSPYSRPAPHRHQELQPDRAWCAPLSRFWACRP
ncbi:MAG: hypothetical protein WKG07_11475 [Hymenobacter sp.]